eukprot:4744851-Pleurochrysis_carterae.AAC.1
MLLPNPVSVSDIYIYSTKLWLNATLETLESSRNPPQTMQVVMLMAATMQSCDFLCVPPLCCCCIKLCLR